MKKTDKKIPFTVLLDVEDHETLMKMAKDESRTRAQMVRVLLERVLKKHRPKKSS